MKRDDTMLLTLTFLTGLAIGMYIYIAVFRPMYVPDTVGGEESEANEWSITARRYGDYSNDSTFRLLGDRTYTYIAEDEDVTKEGRISRALMREIKRHDDSLEEYTYYSEATDCASYTDGFDYEYRFIVDYATFDLDTCYTSLGDSSELAILLEAVWDEIEGRGDYQAPRSFADWAEDWIRQNFGTEGYR